MAEAALQDSVEVVVEGRHVAAGPGQDAFGGPQPLGQVLWQLPICSSVVPGHRMIF